MASRGGGGKADEEQGEALLSQEQSLKRAQQAEGAHVSKVKLYTILGTILVLFGLLAVTTLQDWQTFRVEVKAEREMVPAGKLIEDVAPSKSVNAEAAFENLMLEEAEDAKRKKAQEAKAARKAEKSRRAKERKERKRKVEAEVKAKHDFSVEVSDYEKEKMRKRRERNSDKVKNYDIMQQRMQASLRRRRQSFSRSRSASALEAGRKLRRRFRRSRARALTVRPPSSTPSRMRSKIAKQDASIVMMTQSMLGTRVWPSTQGRLRVLTTPTQ